MYEILTKADALALAQQKQLRRLRQALTEMNAVDVAALLDELEPDKLILLFRLLPKQQAAEVFACLEDRDGQQRLIQALSDRELREVLDELFVDDTVDLIEDMPANVVPRILQNCDRTTREQINQLLNYPRDSAGALMTTEFVSLRPEDTVAQAFERIRREGVDKETVYTCYVTRSRQLLGVVTVRQMLLCRQDTPIESIMERNVIFAHTTQDKESVAQTFTRYGLTALPVVDADERLVGIITVDDAMDVLEEETTEDMEKMAAILPGDKPYLRTGVWETVGARLPWLLLLMLSATFTGMILNGFESALAACVVLTSFIPMLTGTGGNSGSQASVAVIRALSLGEVETSRIPAVVWKELRVSVICGLCLAGANFLKMLAVDRWLMANPEVTGSVALVVCVTLALTVVCAKLVGCLLPLLAHRLGIDPAVMASPFISTVVDALSLLIYFAAATRILGI